MAGFWEVGLRAATLAKRVRAYNAAVTRKARQLAAQGRADLIPHLPARKTVEGVKAEIGEDMGRYRRIVGNVGNDNRSSQLNRVLKKHSRKGVDPLEPTVKDGAWGTEYGRAEKRYDRAADVRRANRERSDLERSLGSGDEAVDFGSMSGAEMADLMDDTDLRPPDDGEPDDSVEEGLDPTLKERWDEEDAARKRGQASVEGRYETYRTIWTDPANRHDSKPGYDMLLEALDWLFENRPDYLAKMFNMGAAEMEYEWIVDSGGKSNPYINISGEERHNRAVNYIAGKARSAGWNG